MQFWTQIVTTRGMCFKFSIGKYLLFFSLLFFSCDLLKPPERTKVICLLCDLSESTNNELVRQAYCKNLDLIFKKIDFGDVLVSGIISEHSINEMNFIVNYQFPELVLSTDNPLFKKNEEEKLRKRFSVCKDSLQQVIVGTIMHNPRVILKTEIINSLHQADRVFSSYNKSCKILIIFSDMLEDSDLYRFEYTQLSSSKIEQILATEESKQRLPDLSNVTVYVVGAAAPDTERYFQLWNFWSAYFIKCGAEISKVNYGSSLVTF